MCEFPGSQNHEVHVETCEFEPDDLFLRLVRQLRDVAAAGRVRISKMQQGYSGALVLLMTLYRRDGQELPTSVLKYDLASELQAEALNTKKYGPLWGAAHPQVLDLVLEQGGFQTSKAGPQAGDHRAVVQLDLCGGSFGVPGLIRHSAVVTLAEAYR